MCGQASKSTLYHLKIDSWQKKSYKFWFS